MSRKDSLVVPPESGRRARSGAHSRSALAATDATIPVAVPDESELSEIFAVEDGEAVAAGVVEELVDAAAAVLYQRYLQERLTPFVASQTKQDILRLVAVLQIPRDEGETPADAASWEADPEPVCVPPDVLSRGIVPVKKRPAKVALPVPKISDQPLKAPTFRRKVARSGRTEKSTARDRDGQHTDRKAATRSVSSHSSRHPTATLLEERKVDDEGQRVRERVEHEKKVAEQLKQKMLAAEKEEAEQYERLKMELKGKEYTYDQDDRVIVINPIPAEKLPNHRVKLKVNIKSESHGDGATTGRKGQPLRPRANTTKKKPRQPEAHREPFIKEIAGMQTPMVDSINVAPGVTLREGSRVRTGPKRSTDPSHMSRKEYEGRQAGLLLEAEEEVAPVPEVRKDRVNSIRMAPPSARPLSTDPLAVPDRVVATHAVVSPVPPDLKAKQGRVGGGA